MPITNFINIADFSARQCLMLIDRAIADKVEYRNDRLVKSLMHRALAMIFEKPSLRTRVSFETAMTHLGGHALYLAQDIGLGTREPLKDIARVLGRMCDGIVARTFSHEAIETLAEWSGVPVINALSDYSHPCQAMADMMTAREHFGDLAGRTLTFVGDGNNVARSLAMLCAKLQVKFVLAAPEGYELEAEFVDNLHQSEPAASYTLQRDPAQAVAEADVVYTDTWVSMGQEADRAKRLGEFEGFQVNGDLLGKAPDHAIVMHCLPAYRGYEISDEVMEAHAETIFREAENRLHFQRSLMNLLMAEGGIV